MRKEVESISNLSDYIKVITKEFANRKPNSFYEKERVFFRGQSRQFSLLPSIARPLKKRQVTLLRFENEMVRTLKLQEPLEFANIIYPINMLSKMQHYGLPTRLLDLTENSLVALFFACKRNYKDDNGEVFCFKVEQNDIYSAYSIYANLAAYLYTLSELSEIDLQSYIDTAKYEIFYPRAQREKSTKHVAQQIVEIVNKPLFVLPEMLSEREKRQQAAFIVFPNDLQLNNQAGKLPYFIDNISDIQTKNSRLINKVIVVESKHKRRILKELELLGISEQFLFPEIDKKCSSIKKQAEDTVHEKHPTFSDDVEFEVV